MLKQKEWIDVIVTKTGCTKKEAKLIYDCMFEYIKEQISEETPIKIPGFGVFKLRKTAAKEQINLITGQPEIVPEHHVATFKPYFEIDPKPEAIEVEDEEVIEEVIVEQPVVVEVEEEVVEEEVEEEAEEEVEETPVVEETPAEEVAEQEVVEEAVPVVEQEVVEEVTPEVEEDVVEEAPLVIPEDNIVWVYGKEKLTTAQVVDMLQTKTELSAHEIVTSLDIVKTNLAKVNKTTCEIKETKETYDFIIVK